MRVNLPNGLACLLGALLCVLVCAPPARAIGRARYVEFKAAPGAFVLFDKGVAAPILLDSQDYPGVLRAARDLQADVGRVTKTLPALLFDETPRAADVVVVGTLGKSRLIDGLARAGKLRASDLRGLWEAGFTQVLERPWPDAVRLHRRGGRALAAREP